jgi:hypothetical protein
MRHPTRQEDKDHRLGDPFLRFIELLIRLSFHPQHVGQRNAQTTDDTDPQKVTPKQEVTVALHWENSARKLWNQSEFELNYETLLNRQ